MEYKYTEEQLKAAYALNLCTVSVSQIIDYDDINIMEQEYEGILNNLNLEQMPKDEALLKIIKQILDTITFFRIQEGDKKFIEKRYQQKMKNAIWSAVPNIGMLVASGDPVVMAVSLASQVGMGYMNYRKAKADNNLEKEMEMWQLERTAIDQFNGLRRELFDTAWRLSAAYAFPDQFRLTERQIKQYNAILMDNDLIRRYERLQTIQDAFIAYPPFWYYLGNTANAIAGSPLRLSDYTRQQYRQKAKEYFMQYRTSNQQGLQREDPVAAACNLELIDLLDIQKDHDFILQLLDEAIRFSGRANDVLQLASITYLRLNDSAHAADLLRQLVNEQYNTVMNAQLLSSIYVADYIKTRNQDTISRYEILSQRVGPYHLYPLPQNGNENIQALENQFNQTQRVILLQKYRITMDNFINKYSDKFDKLLPSQELRANSNKEVLMIQDRKYQLGKIFSNKRTADEYRAVLRDLNLVYGLFDLLNQMFAACGDLAFMTDPVKDRLYACIRDAILEKRDYINELRSRLEEDQFDYFDMEKLINLSLNDFTEDFFREMDSEIKAYIAARKEMQDFAIAEQNLAEFCVKENLPDPSAAYGKDGSIEETPSVGCSNLFTPQLLGDNEEGKEEQESHAEIMIDLIQAYLSVVVPQGGNVEFFAAGDPRIERYFRNNTKLQKNAALTANTLAVLDNQAARFDFDLIFTEYGIVPVRGGIAKSTVAYHGITLETGKTPYLLIDSHFCADGVDLDSLLELIQKLAPYAKQLPQTASPFALPDLKLPFKKK